MKKKASGEAKYEEHCQDQCHPHGKGKALYFMGIGVVLLMYGLHFSFVTLDIAAAMIGAIMLLKGAVKFVHASRE